MRRGLLASLLGLLAVTGCASSGPSRAGGVVPWVNRPLSLYRTPNAKLIRYPTIAPPCRAGQLRVSSGRGGAATGHVLEEFVFTNIGRRPCLLRGYPTISGETSAGVRQTLHPRHGTFFIPLLAADLAPRRSVFLDVETDDMCAGGRKRVVGYRQLAFRLPRGGVVTGGKVSITEQCGLAISEFGLRERYGEPRARPGTPGTLAAAVHLTTKIRPGTKELRYVVTLRNPTASPVRLRPCPGYTQSVYAPGLEFVHRSFALNCDSVHVIRDHGRIRYAMRLQLPRPLHEGHAPLKFGWSLDTATGPFVGRALSVTKS